MTGILGHIRAKTPPLCTYFVPGGIKQKPLSSQSCGQTASHKRLEGLILTHTGPMAAHSPVIRTAILLLVFVAPSVQSFWGFTVPNAPVIRQGRLSSVSVSRSPERKCERVRMCSLDSNCKSGFNQVRGKPVTKSIVVEVSNTFLSYFFFSGAEPG